MLPELSLWLLEVAFFSSILLTSSHFNYFDLGLIRFPSEKASVHSNVMNSNDVNSNVADKNVLWIFVCYRTIILYLIKVGQI